MDFDYEINDLIRSVYGCRSVKVGALKDFVTVKRKRKIGLKKKILGIFPVYDYDVTYQDLYFTDSRVVTLRNKLNGHKKSIRIEMAFDEEGNTVYWKYNV